MPIKHVKGKLSEAYCLIAKNIISTITIAIFIVSGIAWVINHNIHLDNTFAQTEKNKEAIEEVKSDVDSLRTNMMEQKVLIQKQTTMVEGMLTAQSELQDSLRMVLEALLQKNNP